MWNFQRFSLDNLMTVGDIFRSPKVAIGPKVYPWELARLKVVTHKIA